jgi:hypothetical protein
MTRDQAAAFGILTLVLLVALVAYTLWPSSAAAMPSGDSTLGAATTGTNNTSTAGTTGNAPPIDTSISVVEPTTQSLQQLEDAVNAFENGIPYYLANPSPPPTIDQNP